MPDDSCKGFMPVPHVKITQNVREVIRGIGAIVSASSEKTKPVTNRALRDLNLEKS